MRELSAKLTEGEKSHNSAVFTTPQSLKYAKANLNDSSPDKGSQGQIFDKLMNCPNGHNKE